MKKPLITSLILGAFLLPSFAMAQTVVTTNDLATLKAQLTTLIMQEIAVLQSELDAMLATQTPAVTSSPVAMGGTDPIEIPQTPVVAQLPACAKNGIISSCVVISPSTVQGGATTTFTITASPYFFQTGSGNTGTEACVNGTCIGWVPANGARAGDTLTVAPDGSSLTYTSYVPALPDNLSPDDPKYYKYTNFLIDMGGSNLVDANGVSQSLGRLMYIPVTK